MDYFYTQIIGLNTVGDDLRPTRVVGANVGYSALVWLCVWLCLAFGMKWTGRIAYFTMVRLEMKSEDAPGLSERCLLLNQPVSSSLLGSAHSVALHVLDQGPHLVGCQ